MFGKKKGFDDNAEQDSGGELSSDMDSNSKQLSESETEETVDGEDDVSTADLFASAKIRHLVKILRREVAEGNKTIVFSAFTSMLDLIQPFLDNEDINYVRYDGSMRNDLREASLSRLKKDPDCQVLLCSLRCGALGLNLTAANRVVILEPFWNPVSTFQ